MVVFRDEKHVYQINRNKDEEVLVIDGKDVGVIFKRPNICEGYKVLIDYYPVGKKDLMTWATGVCKNVRHW